MNFSIRAVCLAALALLLPALALAGSWTGDVVRIIDGDTLEVVGSCGPVRVRLFGIDCPERGQPFAQAATAKAVELAGGQRVTVHPTTKDRYGRTVAKVILPDGRDLGLELIKAGLAKWFRKYAPKEVGYQEAEAWARKMGLGI